MHTDLGKNVSPTSPSSEIFLKQANCLGLGHWTGRRGGMFRRLFVSHKRIDGSCLCHPLLPPHPPIASHLPLSAQMDIKTTSWWEPHHRLVFGQVGTLTVTFLFFPPMPVLRVGPEGRKKGKNGSAEDPLDCCGLLINRITEQPWVLFWAGNNSLCPTA